MLSQEVRKMILEARGRGITVAEICRVYGVKERAVYKLQQLVRETGSYEPRLSTRGRKATLDDEGLKSIDKLIQSRPDITLQEIKEVGCLPLSISQIDRIVRLKLGYTYKKRWSMQVNRNGQMLSKSVRSGRRKCH